MPDKESRSDREHDLRKRAEEQAASMPNPMVAVPQKEMQQVLHELQVHQIELEMQNEELRRTQEELEASRAQYFDLYDLAPVGYFTIGEKGLILKANLTGAQLLGFTRTDLIKQPFSRYILSEDQDGYYLHRNQLFKTNMSQRCELRLVKSNANSFWIQMESTVVHAVDGEVISHVVISDITERKRSEDTQLFLAECAWVKSGDDFFAVLARHLATNLGMDYVCIDRLVGDGLNAKTVAVYFDGKFEDNVEYALKDTPCGDVVGQTICCFPKDVRHLFPQDVVLQEMGAESYVGITLWSSAGKPIGLIALISRQPLANPGQAESILKMVSDRAAGELERRDAEEALRQSEAFSRSIVDSSYDCIKVLDMQGRLWFMSENGRKALGIRDMNSVIGMHYADFWKGSVQNDVRQAIEQAKAGGHGSFTGYCPSMDGTPMWWDVRITPILNEKQDADSLLVISRDITERKWADEEIKRLNDDLIARNAKLEFANIELESFIYSVSHDLRAPLRHISGFANLALKDITDKLDDKGKRYLSGIHDGAEKMSRLIDDLLNLSKISRQEIQRREVNVSAIAASIVTELRQAHPGRSVEADIKEGLTAFTDRGLIEIVLSNLIGNAWKFTSKVEHARIEIGSVEQDGKIIYYVGDNGAGFDQTYAGKMFLPFHRLHSETAFEGTGIGLAIVDRIIRLHGGKVWAEGIEGKGAMINFSLA